MVTKATFTTKEIADSLGEKVGTVRTVAFNLFDKSSISVENNEFVFTVDQVERIEEAFLRESQKKNLLLAPSATLIKSTFVSQKQEAVVVENNQEDEQSINFKSLIDKDGIQTVSARELYEHLEIATAFKDWFPRICDYGFVIGIDFNPLKIEQVRLEGNREVKRELQDYQITIEMAKQICMLQRTELGKKYREYFLRLEKAWNTPEAIMARALQVANLTLENAKKQIEVLTPKGEWYDKVADSTNLTKIGTVGKLCGIGDRKIFSVLSNNKIIYKKCDSDGVNYYVPYFEYEKYFQSIPEPFVRNDKKLTRNKLLFNQQGVIWATKRYKVEK